MFCNGYYFTVNEVCVNYRQKAEGEIMLNHQRAPSHWCFSFSSQPSQNREKLQLATVNVAAVMGTLPGAKRPNC